VTNDVETDADKQIIIPNPGNNNDVAGTINNKTLLQQLLTPNNEVLTIINKHFT